MHRHKAGDGLSESSTPSIVLPSRRDRQNGRADSPLDEKSAEMERLEQLMKKHEMGEIPENKWLDPLVFRQIEKLQRTATRPQPSAKRRVPETNGHKEHHNDLEEVGDEDDTDEEKFSLYIDFPRFDHPIVFTDAEYPPPPISTLHLPNSSSDIKLKPPPEVSLGPGINVDDDGFEDADAGRLIRIYDPEVGIRDNPAESKHRRLVRSHRTGVLDRDLKPNAKIRDELNTIMSYGPTHELSPEEKDLVWKFRHHLTRDKRALTKFVKSVSWIDHAEARQAIQLLPKWTEIDVDDALELLGPTFDNSTVRAYAVDRLRKADDEELLLYLLQLVQALKFEPKSFEAIEEADTDGSFDSSLATFLVSRAAQNFKLGNYLHWYLMVECDDRSVEQGTEHRKLFAKVEYSFMTELVKQPQGATHRKTLLRQAELVTILSKISKDIRFSREDRPRKVERLKKMLTDPKNELLTIDPPIPLPLDPTVSITGVYPDDGNVFKSSLYPLCVHFKTSTGGRYPIIFKTGDDLRQDQLVMQIITLMNQLLLQENLDLKLTPYRILATSTSAGGIQFIPSTTLAGAIQRNRGPNPILSYLKQHNPDPSQPLGVRKEVMDTYVKSLAGNCVITYLLGVGDRHLDNLLITPEGKFFHADFGYILGRDPKPFAPLMKIDKSMIDCLGGSSPSNPHYQSFRQYCFTAYNSLRKSGKLLLNLFALMKEANVPDIRIERDRAEKIVGERLLLGASEEEATRHLDGVLKECQEAMMPVVIERLHGFVQHWRA